MTTTRDEVPPEMRYRARSALKLSDEGLEAECAMTFFVAGGPGGQHRNKTASGVRVVHHPTGIVVTAVERRSQTQNRVMAMVRLREKLYALTRIPKKRTPTKPTRSSKLARLDGKRRTSTKKVSRQRNWED